MPQHRRSHRPPKPPESARRHDQQTARSATIDEKQKLVDVTKPVPANSFFATLQWQDPGDARLEVERCRNEETDVHTDVVDIHEKLFEMPKPTELKRSPVIFLITIWQQGQLANLSDVNDRAVMFTEFARS